MRFQGNYFPHRLRPAVEDGVLYAGDAAGHCLPLTGEGIRTALLFGGLAGAELRAVVDGRRTTADAHRRYARASRRRRPVFEAAYAAQWLMPRVPPRLLTGVLGVLTRRASAARSRRRTCASRAPEPQLRPSAAVARTMTKIPVLIVLAVLALGRAGAGRDRGGRRRRRRGATSTTPPRRGRSTTRRSPSSTTAPRRRPRSSTRAPT